MERVININGEKLILVINDNHPAYGVTSYLVPLEVAEQLQLEKYDHEYLPVESEIREYRVPNIFTFGDDY